MSSFKQLPNDLKPREKLQYLGTKELSQQELLAIILQNGNTKYSVMQIAQMWLEKYQTLDNVLNQRINELKTNPGIGLVKAINLVTIKEIFNRINYPKLVNTIITHPSEVYELVKYLSTYKKEHLVVICVDCQGNLLAQEEVYIGSSDNIIFNPKDIMHTAIKHNSYGIIVVHNHPSGNAKPSRADIKGTNKLIEVCTLVNIKVLDHVIIGNNTYHSLRENNDVIFS